MSSVETPDLDASLEFLRLVRPDGWWVLVGIEPDGDGIQARSFAAATESEECRAWLQRITERRWNVYWTVNPTLRAIASKPSRGDIRDMEYLHVDVDPARGRDLDAERDRIRALMLESPPAGIPAPTIVVDSGGGLQAFWRLVTPAPIRGEEAAYESAKRYNQQLEIAYGADPCHNVDRIMRLPGTVNWPDARKRAKGRTPRLASLLRGDGRSYPLTDFTPAQVATQASDEGFSARTVRIEAGNVRRVASLDELPAAVSPRCRVVIAMGQDPDDPNRWPSRSEPLLWVCCEMVRAGVPDDTIYSIITDPDWGISESVLSKGSRMERYAIRQIERAHEEAVDPNLREMNDRHAVIGDIGGKCRVISESFDDGTGRPVISYQTFEDINNRYMNRSVDVPVQSKNGDPSTQPLPLGRWWLRHPLRRTYERVIFAPGEEHEGSYNLWRGFSCEAIPGDCSLYLEHLRRNICRDNEEHYDYVLGWMATAVQRPGEPGHVALVLRGLRGAGKGRFVNHFGSLFGRHYMPVINPIQLVGQFNDHLRDCVVLFADEAFYAGDKRHESILKGLITEEHMMTEAKHLASQVSRNCLHILMAANSDWVVPAGAQERRFMVLDVGQGNLQDRQFFGELDRQMEQRGGREALLHLLLNHDVSNFDARHAPKTAALRAQIEHSLQPQEEWWYQILLSGQVEEGEPWPEWIPCTTLSTGFSEYMQQWGPRSSRSNQIQLTRLLERMGVTVRQLTGAAKIRTTDGERRVNRPRIYKFPTLEEARATWSTQFGGDWSWPDEAELERGGEEPLEEPFE